MLTFSSQFLINISFDQLQLTFVKFFDQGKDCAKDILVPMWILWVLIHCHSRAMIRDVVRMGHRLVVK